MRFSWPVENADRGGRGKCPAPRLQAPRWNERITGAWTCLKGWRLGTESRRPGPTRVGPQTQAGPQSDEGQEETATVYATAGDVVIESVRAAASSVVFSIAVPRSVLEVQSSMRTRT